jgi:hypothetical protein
MEDDLKIKMEKKAKKGNLRQPQFLLKIKDNLYFFTLRDDLNFVKMEDDLIYIYMEDDIKKINLTNSAAQAT